MRAVFAKGSLGSFKGLIVSDLGQHNVVAENGVLGSFQDDFYCSLAPGMVVSSLWSI